MPFPLTPERAEELYPHLFRSPKFAALFKEKIAPKATPEQIGQGILRLDAAWRRRRRKQIDDGIEPGTPPEKRRLLVSQIITQETTPGRPSAARTFLEGAKEEFRGMRETTGALAERAVARPERLARRLAGLPEQEPGVLASLARGFGAEIPLLPVYALGGAGLGALGARGAAAGASAIPRAAAALLRAASQGSLPARAAATAGIGTLLEAPVAPLAAATTPEGMEETVLQRLLMAGLFSGAVPVAGAGARGLVGAARQALTPTVRRAGELSTPVIREALAVPPPGLQPAAGQARIQVPPELVEAFKRLRQRGPPSEATVRARGPGFEATAPGRPTGTPTPRPGMVRFYHGGVGKGGSRWFSPDPEYAAAYARKSGRLGQVWYIDLPEDSPLLHKLYDDTGLPTRAPFGSFEAPETLARQARPMGDLTVRERIPAAGAAREEILRAQRPRTDTVRERVPMGPDERMLAELEAIGAMARRRAGLEEQIEEAFGPRPDLREITESAVGGPPGLKARLRAQAEREAADLRQDVAARDARAGTAWFGQRAQRQPVAPVRPGSTPPFDAGRYVLPTDTPEVAATVRRAAEERYQKRYEGLRTGAVPPREAAHRATQAAEKAARLQRQDAAKVARLSVEIPADEAAARAARPGIVAAAKAARAAGGREAEAILGRTVTPEVRAGAAESAAALRQAAQPARTLGQKKRELARALDRMAARLEGEADVPKARTPRPPGPMGRVRHLERRFEQDRVDRILEEYLSPADISTPRPIPGPPPAVPPPPPGPPPPPSPEVAEVLTKVGRFFELNNPTGMRGVLAWMRNWLVGPGHRGPAEVAAAFNALRGATNAGRLNSTLAMRTLNKLVGGRPRTNAELWTPDSPALARELQATRQYIDDNSRQIIEELRAAGRTPDDPLIRSIEEHIGTYVRRQYAQPWRPPERVLEPAVRLLLADNVRAMERRAGFVESALARDDFDLAAFHASQGRLLNGDEIAAAIYRMAQGDESVSLVGQKLGRLNLSLLKKRTDIPVELRRVMGEIEGLPAVGITIADQERFLGTLQFHRKLYGLGYFGTAPDTARGWTRQLPGSPGRDPWANEWTADGVQSLGLLAGKWTTTDIYSGLAENAARQNEILQWVGAASGLWRAGKLIAMPTIMHNFYGNAGHAVTAGTLSYNPAAQIRDLAVAAVELRRYATRGIGERGGAVDNAIRDGVLDAEMATSEFRPALDMFIKAAQRRIEGGGSEALIALARGLEGAERGMQLGFKAFDFPDQLWKLDAYMKTVRRVRMQLPRATDAEVRERAARHVLNYFPDYGGVGKGVKAARGASGLLTTQFVTYQAEWARIIGGIGYRSGFGTAAERSDAMLAAVRLAGFTGLMFGIAAIMQRMHGLNAAEVAALQGAPGARIGAATAELAERSTRQMVKASKPISFIWAFRDARGRPEMVDMTYFHPFADWFKHYPGESPAGRMLNAAADHFLAPHIAKMFVSPIAEEMGAEPGFERPSTIQSLYATLEPRTLLSVRRVVEKMFGPEARLGFMPPAFPKTDEPTAGQMFMNEVLGIPFTPIGPVEQQGADIEQAMIPKEMIRAIIRAQNEPPHRLSPAQREKAEKEAEERAERKQKRYR